MEIESITTNMWVVIVSLTLAVSIIAAVDGFIFGRLTKSSK